MRVFEKKTVINVGGNNGKDICYGKTLYDIFGVVRIIPDDLPMMLIINFPVSFTCRFVLNWRAVYIWRRHPTF